VKSVVHVSNGNGANGNAAANGSANGSANGDANGSVGGDSGDDDWTPQPPTDPYAIPPIDPSRPTD
jgi:hypothetical protein